MKKDIDKMINSLEGYLMDMGYYRKKKSCIYTK